MSANVLGYHDVKDYGAQGDNATDDGPAIAAAIAAAGPGGTVYFSPGSYRHASAISCASNGQTFIFAPGATVKPLAGSSANSMFYVTGQDVRFCGPGVLDGNRGAANVCAFHFENADGFVVDGITMNNTRYGGIYARNCSRFRIRDVTVTGFGQSAAFPGWGIFCTLNGSKDQTDFEIVGASIDCSSLTDWGAGLAVTSTGTGRARRGRFDSVAIKGYTLRAGETDSTFECALISECDDIDIVNFRGAGGFEALGLGNATNCRLSHIVGVNNSRYGLELAGAQAISVASSRMIGAGGWCYRITDSEDIELFGCHAENPTRALPGQQYYAAISAFRSNHVRIIGGEVSVATATANYIEGIALDQVIRGRVIGTAFKGSAKADQVTVRGPSIDIILSGLSPSGPYSSFAWLDGSGHQRVIVANSINAPGYTGVCGAGAGVVLKNGTIGI